MFSIILPDKTELKFPVGNAKFDSEKLAAVFSEEDAEHKDAFLGFHSCGGTMFVVVMENRKTAVLACKRCFVRFVFPW